MPPPRKLSKAEVNLGGDDDEEEADVGKDAAALAKQAAADPGSDGGSSDGGSGDDSGDDDSSSSSSDGGDAKEIDAEDLTRMMAIEAELEANPNLYDKHIEVRGRVGGGGGERDGT
jgi:hypothetical protein